MNDEHHVDLDDENDDVPEVEREFAGQGSTLDRIKRRRDERLADETLRLPLPTWNGDLVGVYRVIEAGQQKKLIRQIERSDGAMHANAKFLIAACIGIEMRDEEDNLKPIEKDGLPVTFDQSLAAKLDIDADSQTSVLLYICGSNPLAVGSHASDVMKWMQDTSKPIDGAIQGE
jgi:hypothetical protein